MQSISRRPAAKKTKKQARAKAANRRQLKRQHREHQRKLARKLNRMANMIDRGGYRGIANSPLLRLNWDYVIKRSLVANKALKKAALRNLA
jgi:hypothetical protein